MAVSYAWSGSADDASVIVEIEQIRFREVRRLLVNGVCVAEERSVIFPPDVVAANVVTSRGTVAVRAVFKPLHPWVYNIGEFCKVTWDGKLVRLQIDKARWVGMIPRWARVLIVLALLLSSGFIGTVLPMLLLLAIVYIPKSYKRA